MRAEREVVVPGAMRASERTRLGCAHGLSPGAVVRAVVTTASFSTEMPGQSIYAVHRSRRANASDPDGPGVFLSLPGRGGARATIVTNGQEADRRGSLVTGRTGSPRRS